MPRINFNQAREFLGEVIPDDSVAVIHHDDGDGFCSGAIFYDWCEGKNAHVEEFTYMINESKLKDFNLEKFNKLIITDLASKLIAEQLIDYKDKKILFVDHHPLDAEFPKDTLVFVTDKEGYIPASRIAGELTENYNMLSLTGTLNDMGQVYKENNKFIETVLKKVGMNLEEFQEKVSNVISNTIIYFNKNHKKIFELIKGIKSVDDIRPMKKYSDEVEGEIRESIKEYETKKEKLGNINFYYFEPKFAIKGPVVNLISNTEPEKIFIFTSPSSSNYNKISISARNQGRTKNVSKILEETTKNIEDSNAGGHPFAAGGALLRKDLKKFKENIRNYIEK